QPSVWDGLPNALLEAMACERLVIASDAGGIPEVLTNEQDGFVIPRHQLHRLGEAVLDVVALDDERKTAVRRRARERVLAEQSAAKEAAALRRVLAALGARP
ncbi:MAG: glycosyltransferase, partial [Deltaproteobacteria bacterium]